MTMTMPTTNFEHKMAAHCETGTVSAILHHAGLTLSEPMVFGMAGGILFAYLKVPVMKYPVLVTRSMPGTIRKKLEKRLKIGFDTRRYRDPAKARAALDETLGRGVPVAVQLDVFYMDYIPDYMRIHFNAHFVNVIGKTGTGYLVSDCYQPKIEEVRARSIDKGRFARGEMAPRGLCFHPTRVPSDPDLKRAVVDGIREAGRNMVKLPVPFLGVRGIRSFGRKIVDWPDWIRDQDELAHQMAMINIILEERGTGGAGFRFMYATFLQEAAKLLDNGTLAAMSKEMMGIGDRWREISLTAARIGKQRDFSSSRFKQMQELIMARADEEENFFRRLLKAV